MTDIPNGFYRTSIKALIFDKEKRFLLFLEENGLWELPGGGLDFGEKPDRCLNRELKEESGLKVTFIQTKPSYFITGQNFNGQWKSIIVYEVTVKDLEFKASEECVNLKFFTKEAALKENLYPTVREFVKEFNPDNH